MGLSALHYSLRGVVATDEVGCCSGSAQGSNLIILITIITNIQAVIRYNRPLAR